MNLTQLSLTNYCASRLPRNNVNDKTQSNIINYCRFQSQIKAIVQKDNYKFNTAFNKTQLTKAMRYSQLTQKK